MNPEFCLAPDKLESLLDEISRHRALTPEETDMLEALICRGHQSTGRNFRWKPADDRALMKASRKRGGIQQFADERGIARQGAYSRLSKIRAKREGKLQSAAKEG